MIAVCAGCEREKEVVPYDSSKIFIDLCNFCVAGLHRGGVKIEDLTPKERTALADAGNIALALGGAK